MSTRFDFAVVGGGIVGLATAAELQRSRPDASILVLEKESSWASHQTGHNSGVIHSGIYYRPGSLKAVMARDGNSSMFDFCARHSIPHERCGKLIVATSAAELPRLEALERRARENGITAERLSPERAREIEPNVSCVAALEIGTTGIVNYRHVCDVLASLLAEHGAELRLQTKVTGYERRADARIIVTSAGDFEANFVVVCAGLESDRQARKDGVDAGATIVPFRGEYYELVPEKRSLVRSLVYPVPNPDFPFLGVHFTRMIDGSVHAGPNAVLGLSREAYRKSDINAADLWEVLVFPGFWRLALRNAREGMKEIARSMSKRLFVRSLQRLIPCVEERDLVAAGAGVRAQALTRQGNLVDDFLLVHGDRSLHVCNAPSPAATASFEIAKRIVREIGA